MKNAGGYGRDTVLLITDSQIKEEGFLEDIDALLNAGDVPNIFNAEEKGEIMVRNFFLFNLIHWRVRYADAEYDPPWVIK